MHEVPLSVRLAISAKFFAAWTITSEQWVGRSLPSTYGVAINTLFFSSMVSPLDHHCWLICWIGSQYDAVFSVEVFTVVCGARDIRHVARRRASQPGGQFRGAARVDCQHEPTTLVVDFQTGRRRPGKNFRTVSTSPLTSDMTVMCTSAAWDFYSGFTASGHRGQYSEFCQYEYAVHCNSGSSGGAAGDAGPRVFDTPAVAVQLSFSAGPYSAAHWVGFGDLRSAAGGILGLCTSHGLGGGRVITDRTVESSVPILGVWWSAVYRWKPGIWSTASYSS